MTKSRQSLRSSLFFLLAAFLTYSLPARALEFTETTDAGAFPSSSADTTGTVPLTSIKGFLDSGGGEVDMYKIVLTGSALFSASTASPFGGSTDFDSQLFLFDSAGFGLLSNDDCSDLGCGSASRVFDTLAAGTYYLAITEYDDHPVSSGGPIFAFNGTPTGPGGEYVLSGWEGDQSFDGGNYRIALLVSPVPEPETYALLLAGLGLLGFVARRRNQQRAA